LVRLGSLEGLAVDRTLGLALDSHRSRAAAVVLADPLEDPLETQVEEGSQSSQDQGSHRSLAAAGLVGPSQVVVLEDPNQVAGGRRAALGAPNPRVGVPAAGRLHPELSRRAGHQGHRVAVGPPWVQGAAGESCPAAHPQSQVACRPSQ